MALIEDLERRLTEIGQAGDLVREDANLSTALPA
jgi:hypothetical protein